MRNRQWVLIVLSATIFASLLEAESLVRCPGVGVQSIRREASRYELSFVFYYTSWSNASLEARKVYNGVVDLFKNQFHYFAEIDCWHMACNCSKTHELGTGLPSAWPTLMIGFARRIKLQYYGEWNKGDLIRFINRLYRPIERLRYKNETEEILQETDAVILGIFPNPSVIEYKHYLIACVQWLEVDPNFSFRFAAIFGPAARQKVYRYSNSESYILHFNEERIDIFDEPFKWNNTHIVHWLHKELKRSFSNMTAYNSPATIALLSKRAPVLVCFLNDMHLYTNFKHILPKYKFTVDKDKKLPYPNTAFCSKMMDVKKPKSVCLAKWRKCCYNHRNINHSYLKHYHMWERLYDKYFAKYVPQIPEADFYYYNVKTNEDLTKIYRTNLCFQEATQLITPQHKMRINKHLRRKSIALFRRGYRAGRNNSLAIVILHRYKYRDFVEKQGLFTNTRENRSKPVVSIFDTAGESAYLMRANFSIRALEEFMVAYYRAELKRHLAISANEDFDEVVDDGEDVFIEEYNREALMMSMQAQAYTAIILFYSTQCPLTGTMAHAMTQVANFLKSSKDELRFIRFNVQSNTVPWHLEMPNTPSLVIFPKGHYEDSRVFPKTISPDFAHLTAFIIAQLDPVQQVRAILHSCKHFAQVKHLFLSCLEYSRTLVTEHISDFLKLWQIHESERQQIFNQLKNFKDIGLSIQQSFQF